ncbi:uncharacterized protein LOC115881590 [Sitophilus oryzae]|uniref:Uncharacterized protein LOC115881590 n=1 Tax=Sitophilus oryzae TaxID=7048 RepID=A0A6J2XTW3_SITOR|nr:uncharacterized protein LOC115881590 [Sitophilus oryzae]
MKVYIGIVCYVLLNFSGSDSFIIPDELPSILSVIYSNIPTFKKGTDSRIGWGFRLGDRADFQVMVELGPQLNTQPLANQGGSSTNKRSSLNNLANTLYAQRQQEKKENQVRKQEEEKKQQNTDAENWINTWSKKVSSQEENETEPLKPKPGIAIGEIDAKSVIPDDNTEDIKNKKFLTKTTVPKLAKTTNAKNVENEGPLDDVALD